MSENQLPDCSTKETISTALKTRWTRELNGYHWFVLIVCTLGWMFDTMDQHLFNLARVPAINALEVAATEAGNPPLQSFCGISLDWGMIATSMLLLGWGTGGIIFGMMGDRLGRAKTMIFTILAYSVFTGLSGLATTVYDFCIYRFLMGCGVGAQFAVGVSLVAETVPQKSRPHALGFLQACSAFGNIAAALIGILFSYLIGSGLVAENQHWRYMFFIGILPAILALFVMRYLKEPEAWLKVQAERKAREKETQVKELGPIREMFTVPRWRRNAIVGMVLASSGVLGLWSIGVFTPDLNRQVLRKSTAAKILAEEPDAVANDMRYLRTLWASPEVRTRSEIMKIDGKSLFDLPNTQPGSTSFLFARLLTQENQPNPVETASEPVIPIAAESMELSSAPWENIPEAYVESMRQYRFALEQTTPYAPEEVEVVLTNQVERQHQFHSDSAFYAAVTLLFFMTGAFFGIYGYTILTTYIGRRPAFAIAFFAAALTTALYFLYVSEPWMVYAFSPIVGFCQLALFGGYAIYFPELFPTRIRSTGTSFCYNIARFVAALGPVVLSWLKSDVFGQMAEPLRYGGAAMCVVFLIGIAILPFAPETKDQPLPE